MSSVNRVTLVGRLGKDPEPRTAQSGMKIVKLSLATDRYGKGEKATDWHNIVVFGNAAEACERYLSKGRQVYVEGRIQYNKYEKDGETKYFTEIVASEVTFLGGNQDSGGDRGGYAPKKQSNLDQEVPVVDADECPF